MPETPQRTSAQGLQRMDEYPAHASDNPDNPGLRHAKPATQRNNNPLTHKNLAEHNRQQGHLDAVVPCTSRTTQSNDLIQAARGLGIDLLQPVYKEVTQNLPGTLPMRRFLDEQDARKAARDLR